MFGYVIINRDALSEAEFTRFRAHYCGLCHQLYTQYGLSGCATLSYDLTFLQLLLASLYEPEEENRSERCLLHPLKKHDCVITPVNQYAADMNVAMTWHKCRDNWADDKSVLSLAEKKLLDKAYLQVEARYPEKCAFVADCIDQLSQVEKSGDTQIDRPTNLTGQIFGEMFAYKDDMWCETLRSMGEALGRFVYLMDAYEKAPLQPALRPARAGGLRALHGAPAHDDHRRVHRRVREAAAGAGHQHPAQHPLLRRVEQVCDPAEKERIRPKGKRP